MRVSYDAYRGVMNIFSISCCIIVIACGGSAVPTAHDGNEARNTRPEHLFTADSDPDAVRLFEKRRAVPDESDNLAEHYAERGYTTLAQIYAGSRGAVQGSRAAGWLCSTAEISGDSIKEQVAELSRRRGMGDYAGAASYAEMAISSDPRSCQLKVEWSIAIIMAALVDPRKVDIENQERAIRVLVTAAAELGIYPEGYSGGGQTLYEVARYFRRIGDVSAYARVLQAALRAIAVDERATDSPTLLNDYADLRRRIERELGDIQPH
jgi:hypothetical protein